ncbi:hypothetical protein LCI18_005112 [Fusarium solani-melongenae]|uniref:Uncharacterized protein n=1 Tax=Fusarium solani subsp. cucurbitae TaxID=2747967 RepID=A0ACD3YZ78_FUSSC|nr:hypothetical protein LCI18_005112 [Fusarium solani-melongenae]
MCLVAILGGSSQAHALHTRRDIGMRVRSRLTAAICDKALTASSDGDGYGADLSVLVEVDLLNVFNLIEQMQALWLAPLEVLFSLGALIYILGWHSTLAGAATTCFLLPFLVYSLQNTIVKMSALMQARDARVAVVTEILDMIKPIKLCNWQGFFGRRIDAAREAELRTTARIAYINGFLAFLTSLTPTLLVTVSFGMSFFLGRNLTSDTVFPALALFANISRSVAVLPQVAMLYQAGTISYLRAREFLNCREKMHLVPLGGEEPADGCRGVRVTGADFDVPGNAGEAKPLLLNCNIRVPPRALVAISGPVGSGKTTLLRAILGEVEPRHGKVVVGGKVAYAPQDPFLINGTIRQNITFGLDFNAEWYSRVLDACALVADLSMMAGGDATFLGGTGAALSGGQKSRVALARVVYSKPEVAVLDDPFAAIDRNVQKQLISNLFGPDGLLKDCACVVSSSTPALTRTAQKVYLIDNLKIKEVEVDRSQSPALDSGPNQTRHDETLAMPVDSKQVMKFAYGAVHTISKDAGSNLAGTQGHQPLEQDTECTALLGKGRPDDVAPLSETEAVGFGTYLDFFNSASSGGWVIALSLVMGTKIIDVVAVYYLRLMSEEVLPLSGKLRLLLFTTLSVSSALGSFLFVVLVFRLCLIPASSKIHRKLTEGVLGSKFVFIDTTPIGQIINRFTNDINKVDTPISGGLLKVTALAAMILIVVSVLGCAVPVSILIMVPVALIYYKIQAYYLYGYLQLRRWENNSRGPILNALNEMLLGQEVIRSCGRVRFFQDRARGSIDDHALAAGIMLYQGISPAALGMVMNYTMQITNLLTLMMQASATLEADMVSMQRLNQYSALPPEESESASTITPPSSWPATPVIKFRNYSARHRPGAPLCLRNLDVTIAAGERVAVVGRTGAGKSSLSLALLRALQCVEPGGHIEIDGIDIALIPRTELRRRIAVIPQDPVAFRGTLRENLDPIHDRHEDEIRAVVRECRLPEALGMATTADPLEYEIAKCGSNMSAGQTQLVAIARAMLARRKIIILDEATAAVDRQLDELIQSLLERDFQGSTIIAIAHKLESVV